MVRKVGPIATPAELAGLQATRRMRQLPEARAVDAQVRQALSRLADDFDVNHSTFQLETPEHVLWEARAEQAQH